MLSKLLKTAAAGNAAGEGLYVEDVFSTYLYEGVNASQTITNGIDLDGEGGLVWLKRRSGGVGTAHHELFDTERGVTKEIFSNLTNGEQTDPDTLTAFNSNGFTIGADATINYSGDYASWTFRKAPKFFDVVTYTGNGTAPQTISHNLGSVPGCIIVKDTTAASDWYVYHRGIDATAPENYRIYLNQTASRNASAAGWSNIAPTDTQFTVGSGQDTTGNTYVAYLFAHNDGDGEFGENADQDIIKCGSFTASGGTASVTLGFEPQLLMFKRSDETGNWAIYDDMRGMPNGSNKYYLAPNSSGSETSFGNTDPFEVNATGFEVDNSYALPGGSNGVETYIYIAIRRGPMKTPESGTEVFAVDSGGNGDSPAFVSNFPVDLGIRHPDRDQSGNGTYWSDRLRGDKYLKADSTAAEVTITAGLDQMDGFEDYSALSDAVGWMFRRAPGFFDVVAYEGNSTDPRNITHNLGVVPEMIIIKNRTDGGAGSYWIVYHTGTGNSNVTLLQSSIAKLDADYFNDTDPTDSVFTVKDTGSTKVNYTGNDYIAYLFATLPGISKVGSYSGTSALQVVDCGFSAGARFLIIKRTDSTSSWYVWDTERGIVTGNDPYLLLDSTSAETTNDDYIDPNSSGFELSASSSLNVTGREYIFLAIA